MSHHSKSISTITGCALLCALYIALQMITINLGPTLQINFSFLALALSCCLYGLWPNLIFAFAADLLGFLVHPDGAYMPLFALVLMVKAVIYVIFFYNRQPRLSNILMAQLLVNLLCNVLLNTLIVMLMYQMPFWSLAITRLWKNVLMYPIECILLYLLFRLALRLPAFRALKDKSAPH